MRADWKSEESKAAAILVVLRNGPDEGLTVGEIAAEAELTWWQAYRTITHTLRGQNDEDEVVVVERTGREYRYRLSESFGQTAQYVDGRFKPILTNLANCEVMLLASGRKFGDADRFVLRNLHRVREDLEELALEEAAAR